MDASKKVCKSVGSKAVNDRWRSGRLRSLSDLIILGVAKFQSQILITKANVKSELLPVDTVSVFEFDRKDTHDDGFIFDASFVQRAIVEFRNNQRVSTRICPKPASRY